MPIYSRVLRLYQVRLSTIFDFIAYPLVLLSWFFNTVTTGNIVFIKWFLDFIR